MAGGPILPSSIYLGGASGLLYPIFYLPNTNTTGAGAFEGIGCVGSLGSNAPAVMQFNLPEVLPTGVAMLRVLGMANASSGQARINLQDFITAAGASLGIGTTPGGGALTQEGVAPTLIQTWAAPDILVERKFTLTAVPVANSIYSLLATYTAASWSLTAASAWQYSLVWE